MGKPRKIKFAESYKKKKKKEQNETLRKDKNEHRNHKGERKMKENKRFR